MKILLIGGGGVVGTALKEILTAGKHKVLPTKRNTYSPEILSYTIRYDYAWNHCFINQYQPDVVILNAAYSNVEQCEKNPFLAYWQNTDFPIQVASITEELGIPIVFISSLYAIDPLNVYGETKADAEHWVMTINPKHTIVRTNWVFGPEDRTPPNNFLGRSLTVASNSQVIRYPKAMLDEISHPTYSFDLARFIANLIHHKYFGIFHGVSSTRISRCKLLMQALEVFGYKKTDILYTRKDERKAVRPAELYTDDSGWNRSLSESLEDYCIRSPEIQCQK